MNVGFIIILLALLFVWLALVRPQRRRQAAQTQMWQNLKQGDEVVTAGGIYGEVTGFQGDDVVVEIAPDLEVRVARRAIGGIVPPPEAVDEAGGDEELEASEDDGGTPVEDGAGAPAEAGHESYPDTPR
jgi:preprotein translocase subunit YajC